MNWVSSSKESFSAVKPRWSRIRLTIPTESGVDLANVKMTMNPFCENALEEALRLREGGIAEEIIVASVGGGKTEETLRHGLAMGADRAIQVVTEDALEPLAIAKVLKQVAEQEGVALVLAGKQAIDDDSNQTAQMLSALLGWSQATYCSEIKIEGDQPAKSTPVSKLSR
jgi:electron transfer flavoprotein beta subunit